MVGGGCGPHGPRNRLVLIVSDVLKVPIVGILIHKSSLHAIVIGSWDLRSEE